MRRLTAAMAAIVCALGFSTAPISPAAADSVTVGESGWSVALTFPDMRWSSWSCQFLPVSAVVTGATVQSWTFGGFVNASSEDSEEEGGYTWFIDYDHMVSQGPGSFAFRHAVLLCPNGYDQSGPYGVVGEVGVLLAGATEWTWRPYRATFTVTGIPTVTTLDPITVSGGEATFTGRSSPSEPVPVTFEGCGAWVVIEMQVGADSWEWVGDTQLMVGGLFSATVPTYRLTGTQFRARVGESVCAASTSAPQALPVRLPVASVSTASRDSKLKVDIDPNRGRGAWTFQVQRERDGSWRKVGTYRTLGSRETRTINLPKGCYRVRVPAQAGYAETYSESICLAR